MSSSSKKVSDASPETKSIPGFTDARWRKVVEFIEDLTADDEVRGLPLACDGVRNSRDDFQGIVQALYFGKVRLKYKSVLAEC